jgi:hypothetical protein
MAYTTEVRHLLATRAGMNLDDGGHDRVQLIANVAINARQADWHECFVGALSDETGMSREAFELLLAGGQQSLTH